MRYTIKKTDIFTYIFMAITAGVLVFSLYKPNTFGELTSETFMEIRKYDRMFFIAAFILLIFVLGARAKESLVVFSKSRPMLYLIPLPIFLLFFTKVINFQLNDTLFIIGYLILAGIGLFRLIQGGNERYGKNPSADFKYIPNTKFVEFIGFLLFYGLFYFIYMDILIMVFILFAIIIFASLYLTKKELKTKFEDFKYIPYIMAIGAPFVVFYITENHENFWKFSIGFGILTLAYFLLLRNILPVKKDL